MQMKNGVVHAGNYGRVMPAAAHEGAGINPYAVNIEKDAEAP